MVSQKMYAARKTLNSNGTIKRNIPIGIFQWDF